MYDDTTYTRERYEQCEAHRNDADQVPYRVTRSWLLYLAETEAHAENDRPALQAHEIHIRVYRTVVYNEAMSLYDVAHHTGESEDDVMANYQAGTLTEFLADYATPELNDAVTDVDDQIWDFRYITPKTPKG